MALSKHAHVAKLIRAELKKHGVKGRVRAQSYAGGSSVDVCLTDEPPATVKAIKKFCGQFEMGYFDAMNDIYEYSNMRDDIPQVKFVFVLCEYSDELRQAAWDHARGHYADCEGAPEDLGEASNWRVGSFWASKFVYQILNGSCDHAGFWSAHKPRKERKQG